MRKTKECLAVLCLAFFVSCGTVFAQRYTITDIGTLGGATSGASAINDLGQVVGTSDASNVNWYAFVWNMNSGMQGLGTLGGPWWGNSVAHDINDIGQIVGAANAPGDNDHAFFWQNGNMVDLGTLGGEVSVASRINNSGQIIGPSDASQGPSLDLRSFLYDGGTMRDLTGLVPGMTGWELRSVQDINNQGEMLGYGLSPMGDIHSIIWDGGSGFWDIGLSGNPFGSVYRISDARQVIGMVYGHSHLAVWNEIDGVRDLGSLGGLGRMVGYSHGRDYYTGPWSINKAGDIVGMLPISGSNAQHGFIWSAAGGLQDLNNLFPPGSGWVIFVARDINNLGQIVGEGVYAGNRRALLLTPWPHNLPSQQQSGTFGTNYDVGFTGSELRIKLDIHLTGYDPGYALIQEWEKGVESIWSNQYDIVDGATAPYPIVLDVEFVDSDWDVVVKVIEGDCAANMITWCTGSPSGWPVDFQDKMAAHEVGHMLGLYDEYRSCTVPDPSDPWCKGYGICRGVQDPDNPICDLTSIMGSLGVSGGAPVTPKDRHFESILKWLERESGWDMVLAASPLYQPGNPGNPVDDESPVCEPATIPAISNLGLSVMTLLFVGGAIVLVRRRLSLPKEGI